MATQLKASGLSPPKKLELPNRVALRLTIAIEDCFDAVDRMPVLLVEWPHRKMVPLTAIAEQWTAAVGQDVSEDFLRYIMSCYGVSEIDIPVAPTEELPEEVPDIPETQPEPQGVDWSWIFRGNGPGMVCSRIVMTYQLKRSWSETVESLQQIFPDLTLFLLQEWVQGHLINFASLGSPHVQALLEGRDTADASGEQSAAVTPRPSPVIERMPAAEQHPSMLPVTTEQRVAVRRRCAELACTESELFTTHFDDQRIVETAQELQMTPALYLRLRQYWLHIVNKEVST